MYNFYQKIKNTFSYSVVEMKDFPHNIKKWTVEKIRQAADFSNNPFLSFLP